MKQTAQLFKTLSDPTRLRLLNLLRTGEICVCDLMEILDLPQSTVSRHLATLRNAGLVTDERRGQCMYYGITADQTVFSQKLIELINVELAEQQVSRNDLAALEQLKTGKVEPVHG